MCKVGSQNFNKLDAFCTCHCKAMPLEPMEACAEQSLFMQNHEWSEGLHRFELNIIWSSGLLAATCFHFFWRAYSGPISHLLGLETAHGFALCPIPQALHPRSFLEHVFSAVKYLSGLGLIPNQFVLRKQYCWEADAKHCHILQDAHAFQQWPNFERCSCHGRLCIRRSFCFFVSFCSRFWYDWSFGFWRAPGIYCLQKRYILCMTSVSPLKWFSIGL